MDKKVRLSDFDFLRFVATLAVITIHITAGYVTASNIAYALNQVVRFAVPMFIILSGYLLYYSNNKKQSLLSFLKKRLNKIVIPFILWNLIYLLYSYHHKMGMLNIKLFASLFLKGLFIGKGTPHLYFVIIIVQMYILYPLLEKGFERSYDRLLLGISFFITFYFQLGIYLFRWYIYILPKISNYTLMFPTWLFFFVFGMYAAKKQEKLESTLKKFPVRLGLAWLISFIILMTDSKLSNTYGGSAKPTIILYCITSFFFFDSVAVNLKIKNKYVDWLSGQSFFIYLSHILVMNLIKTFTLKVGLKTLWIGVDGMCLLFVATTLATCILAYLLSYVPYSDVLGILPKRKRTVCYNQPLSQVSYEKPKDKKCTIINRLYQ